MISHVKHDVGTEALAKKLNEVIRVMNEGNISNSNIQCDPQLLFDAIIDYGNTCMNYGRRSGMTGIIGMIGITGTTNTYYNTMQRKLAQIKGMLGVK